MHTNRGAIAALALAAVVVAGCGRPPQVGAQNRRLVESLKTAVMARNPEWLDENAKLVKAKHEKGELDEASYAAFESIVRQAEAGDWDAAQDEVIALSKAQ
jgi:hypothetical protein